MTTKNIPLFEIREWKTAHVVITSSICGLSLVGQWVLGWAALPLQALLHGTISPDILFHLRAVLGSISLVDT